MYLYSALFVVPHTQGAQASITQCYPQLHQCLLLLRNFSLGRRHLVITRWNLPRLRLRTSNCSRLFMCLPRKDERLSRPGFLTYSGRFTYLSGHQSAVVERRTAKVRRSKTNVLPKQSTISVVLWRATGQRPRSHLVPTLYCRCDCYCPASWFFGSLVC